MPDMVFSNAIFGSKVLKEGDQTKYSRLKAHIERGLFDIPVDKLPMVTRGEKNLYCYVLSGILSKFHSFLPIFPDLMLY